GIAGAFLSNFPRPVFAPWRKITGQSQTQTDGLRRIFLLPGYRKNNFCRSRTPPRQTLYPRPAEPHSGESRSDPSLQKQRYGSSHSHKSVRFSDNTGSVPCQSHGSAGRKPHTSDSCKALAGSAFSLFSFRLVRKQAAGSPPVPLWSVPPVRSHIPAL